MNGQVLRLRPDKGFGFIKCEDGQERFFHRSRCEPTAPFEQLKVGDYVKFKLEDHEKGCRAVSLEYM
jgi:CspA family cold shock protein